MEHRSATWVYTINNYTEEDIKRLTSLSQEDYFTVFGEEVGAQGTPHLQGYIRFSKRLRRANVEKVLGGHAWCEVTHDEDRALGYSIKDGKIHSNAPIPEGLGEKCRATYQVCKELGMTKYIYDAVAGAFYNDHIITTDVGEIKVYVGYLAWLDERHKDD